MDKLKMYAESFKLKFEKFMTGCDALEEMGLWDKEKNGEMEAFYSADMVSVIIRLTAVDGKIVHDEVKYINDIFGFSYTEEELRTIYADCKEAIDTVFTEGLENGYSYMKRINEKLADAYKELIVLICDIVIESDGVISSAEVQMAERLKALGA